MLVSEPYDSVLVGIQGLSIAAQSYVIYLIFWVTPKSMSEYRWFLFLYTFWDLAFSLVFGLVITPRMFFPGTGCIVQGLGRDAYFWFRDWLGPKYGEWIVKFSITLVFYIVTAIISSQDYCLFYRFTVVYPNQLFHHILVNKKVVAATIFGGTVISCGFGASAFAFLADFEDIPKLMDVYNKTYPGVFNDVQPDSVIIWYDKNNMKVGWIMKFIIIGFILSEIIAGFSVAMILKILRQNASSFSHRTYSLHRQMTILLALQIANPLVFIMTPIGASVMAMIYDLGFSHLSGMIGLMFMSMYSISNMILTIGFVQPYRHFTYRHTVGILLKLPYLKKYQSVVVVAPSSTTGSTINSNMARNLPN